MSKTPGPIAFALFLSLSVNAIGAITRDAYLQQGSSTSIVVRWRTDSPTDSGVRYGTNATNLSLVATNVAITTEHEISLTGLQPDTKYFYAIGTTALVLAGDDSYFFVTAPTNAKSTRIWIIGDSGGGEIDRVAAAYARFSASRDANLWLMLGDNAYPSGRDEEYQQFVFDMFTILLRRTVLWPTIGNHDAAGGPADFPYLHIFSLPTNGAAGGVPSGSERYYSFDYGNIHFVCLDASSSDRSSNGVMCAWLKRDLATNNKDWLIAFWHQPPYTKGTHNSDFPTELTEMRQNVVPILESYGVDLVLCGHSHVYERSFMVDGHYGFSHTFLESMKKNSGNGREDGDGPYTKPTIGPAPHEGTVYMVVGCSGVTTPSDVTWGLNHQAMYFGESQLGSVVIDVNGPVLEATFLRETGAIDDYFTIIKGEAGDPLRVIAYQLTEDTLTLTWNSRPGKRYQVERATSLSNLDWLPANDSIQAASTRMTWSVQFYPSVEHVFYRVVKLRD